MTKKDERDKSLAYLDQHLSKGAFSFVNWGFSPVISRTFTSKFQVETYFNVQSKSKVQWHCYGLSLGVKQQHSETADLLPHPQQTIPESTDSLWGAFTPACARAFPCITLVTRLCNAAKQGQLCRAATAWNTKVWGLGLNKFLFWKWTKWFLPACSLC